MTEPATTEEHPEELLSRAVAGTLDEAQRRTLLDHVARCRPCATQARIAGWMDDDGASNLALLRERATVSRVMSRWEGTKRRRAPLVPRWILHAAAAFALSGMAIAASWWPNPPSAEPHPTTPPAEVSSATAASKPRLRVPGVSSEVTSNEAPSAISAPTLGGAGSRQSESKPPEASDAPSASALFARASELRVGGQSLAAITAFERLQKLHPASRESHLSHLVVGRLWLDNGRPELAAPEFAQYFKAGGAANEEALVGHATALQRLGRFSEEAADWKRLLESHPASLYAAEARKRLAELQQPREGPRHPVSP